jgi:type II secretory pathway predicted ATPase ExeA
MQMMVGSYSAGLNWSEAGLKTNPFPSLSSDFSSPSVFIQQDVFALCEQAKPLHIFSGITGVGKTMHAKQLAKHFLKNKRRPTQLITASKTIKASGLLKMICCRFNIELPAGDLIDNIKIDSIRRMVLKRKEPIALIIDDAHNLSPDALNAVVRLTAMQQSPLKLHLILFGMPVLLDRVRKQWSVLGMKEDFGQGMIRPWSSEQTSAYIASRLQDSGLVSTSNICKKTCQKIHQLSGGVPMQINRRANMMLDQLIKGQIKPAADSVLQQGSFLWMTALLSASTAVYFCYQAYNTPTDPLWMAPEYQIAQADILSAEMSDEMPEELVLSGLEEAMLVVHDREDESLQAVNFEALDQVKEPVKSELISEPPIATDFVSVEQVPSWLSNQEGYTVQVLATPDEAEAAKIAKGYEHSHVLHAARQNKSTYIVLVGEYKTFSEAKEEVSQLSETHEGLQPWIRRFSQLREDVEHLKDIEA